MLDKLVKIANRLDEMGETKLADEVDTLIRKLSSNLHKGMKKDGEILEIGTHVVHPGETLGQITADRRGSFNEVTVEENLKLNPGLDPLKLPVGKEIKVWQSSGFEGGVPVEGMEPPPESP
jgi:hypothetical protein